MSALKPLALTRGRRRRAALGGFALGILLVAGLAIGAGATADRETTGSGIVPEWPEGGHIRVLDPAEVDPDEAEALYRTLRQRMIEGYARSGLANIDYRGWQRFNSRPYVSDQHGARLVNVFGNDRSDRLHRASTEEPMPVGAMVVKDSFSLAASGGLARGPLFTMEKMTPGFFPAGGDWRYTMIMPNGKVFGSTNGEGSAAVAFCAECHKQAAKRDFLFDLPDAFAVGK